MTTLWIILIALVLIAAGIAIWDMVQTHDPIRRNFPLVGHARSLLQSLGPKLRQYIVASNNEERPFTRDQREWVYRSAAKANNYFGFGTDNPVESEPNYLIVKQATFPLLEPHEGDPGYDPLYPLPCGKVLGGYRKRARAFRPASVINVSAMSYGSLSSAAVEAINAGCRIANSLHNTGEGGISPHHDHGGELIYQIGTGYFGCRHPETGRFDADRFDRTIESFPVRAIEIKLSQGAKPGKGGVLPAGKVTSEISDIRGIPMGKDCISPAAHSAFANADELLDFVEMLADRSGLPVGIKSAVGQLEFWSDLTESIVATGRSVDFITIDGGEGGTGAAPLVFADHVSLPFFSGFARVHKIFHEADLLPHIVFIGSGKLGFPANALFAFALGCDMVNVAREAMLAIGCIQAQECHTGHCPTGVATNRRWLMRGLKPGVKSHNLANYLATFRKELLHLSLACGYCHPAFVTTDHLEFLNPSLDGQSLAEHFKLPARSRMPSESDRRELERLMKGTQS